MLKRIIAILLLIVMLLVPLNVNASKISEYQEKQEEARKQMQEYSGFEEIKAIPNLRKYTIVAINDKIYVEEI